MDNDKNTEFDEELAGEQKDSSADSASRARNRTVMLTPEITGEVRARLQQDMDAGSPNPGGAGKVLGGFETPPAAPLSQSQPAAPRGGQFQPPQPQQPAAGQFAPQAPAAPTPQTPPPPAPAFSQAPVQAGPGHEGAVWVKESTIVGFLISYDKDPNGTVFELRNGRLIVTSELPGGGNYLFIDDESVSPMHAIMRMGAGGEIQVLDQLSEFGTKISRANGGDEEELSGDKSELVHGDVIYFGERKFHVCLIMRDEEE